MVALVLVLALSPGSAFAQQATLPQGGQVVNGAATIATADPSTLTITQTSSRAIIDWQDFSIAAGRTVDITQPGAAAALLNRVTGGNLSLIDGRLTANGKVYLLNPQGIVVGPSGTIDTAAFVGSTLNTSNEDFLAGGAVRFTGSSNAGVINLGTIHTADGDVTIIAGKIANAGSITAPRGVASLLSGSEVLYVPGSTGSLVIKAPANAGEAVSIDNRGSIAAAEAVLRAAGSPYALAVKHDGAISATSITREGGRVILDGGSGDVSQTGSIRAEAGDTGGHVDIVGGRVGLSGAAVIDASGATAGGRVRIGGGYRGRDPEVANATRTTMGEGVLVRASATDRGDGGVISVWADESTAFQGTIEATGGAAGGDGGRADVSAPVLDYGGVADLRAYHGATGTLSLDPGSFVIDAGQASTIQTNLDTANVTIDGYDDITVSSPVVNSTTTHTLNLDATDIFIDASLSLPAGTIQFGAPFSPRNSVTSAAGASIAASLIDIASPYSSVTFDGPVLAPGGLLDLHTAPDGGAATSFTATNASNQISRFGLPGVEETFTGSLSVHSSVATEVSQEIDATGDVTIVSSGDLTFDDGGAGTSISASGVTTLASTGGVINTNAALTLGGSGRKRLYSSTTASPFNVSGIAYPQFTGVSFPSDPQTGNVIYIAAGTALPTLTITADDKSAAYGSVEPTYTASFSGGSASDLTSAVQFRLDRMLHDAGTYAIIPFGATSATHTLSYVNGTLTVTPVPLLVSGPIVSSPYGSAIPAFTPRYDGFLPGDGPSDVHGLSLTTSATSRSPVGTYAIVPSGGSAPNYTLSYANGALTITPAMLLVIPNDTSRLYGGTNPLFSASFVGLQNGDSPDVVKGLSFSTTAVENSPVGAYPIAVSGGSASNYQLQFVQGTLSVNRAPLTVRTSSGEAAYGRPIPALTTTATGLVAGDTVQSLGLGYTTTVVQGSHVGTYETSLAGSSSNYDLTYVPGRITIRPAILEITANSIRRFQFEENPTFTATVRGLVGNDQINLRYENDANAHSPAGTYTITPIAEPNPDYLYSYETGTLTVEPPPPLIVGSLVESIKTTDVKIEVPKSNIKVEFSGTGLNTLYYNANAIVSRALDAYGADNDSPSVDELKYLMSSNKMGDNYEVGKLLPFLVGEAQTILDRPESSWTEEERAFIDYMTNMVNEQRKKAAEESVKELEAYKNLQKSEVAKQGVGMLFDFGEVPPKEFIEQVEAGVNVNLISGGAMAGMIGAAAAATVGAGVTAVATGAAATAAATIFPFAAATTAGTVVTTYSTTTAGVLVATKTVTATAGTAAGTTAGTVGGAVGAVVAGAVLIVVVAVAVMIAGAVQFANIQEYDKKMSEAVAKANTPITKDDLKGMLSDEKGQQKVFMQLVSHVASAATK